MLYLENLGGKLRNTSTILTFVCAETSYSLIPPCFCRFEFIFREHIIIPVLSSSQQPKFQGAVILRFQLSDVLLSSQSGTSSTYTLNTLHSLCHTAVKGLLV